MAHLIVCPSRGTGVSPNRRLSGLEARPSRLDTADLRTTTLLI